MFRLPLALVALLPLVQTPVPVTAEPHHTRVLYTAHLRLLEILVPPDATTLDHGHEQDLVVVALGETTIRTQQRGQDWDPPRSYVPGGINVVTYTGSPAVHRMENVGKTPYRVFAVENMRAGGWTTPRIVAAAGTMLRQESRAFSVYEVGLSPAVPQTSHVHQQPTIVFLLSGAVEVQGGGGESEFRMETAGRWFPSSWDQPHTLSLIGGGDARLIEVEAR